MGIEPGYMVTSDDDPTKQVFVPSRAGRDPERILPRGWVMVKQQMPNGSEVARFYAPNEVTVPPAR